MVELRPPFIPLAEQEQVTVGHGDLLGQSFLCGGKSLRKLFALFSIEPIKAVPVGGKIP